MKTIKKILVFCRVLLLIFITAPPILIAGLFAVLAYAILIPCLWLISMDSELRKILPENKNDD